MAARQRTPMQVNTLTMTHIKSRTDKNGNPQTNETQIAVMQNMFPTEASTQEPTWEHKSSRSNTEIPNTWATTLVVSLPQQCCARIVRNLRKCWQSWRLDPPLPCGPEREIQQWHKTINVITRTNNHKHPDQKSLDRGASKQEPTSSARSNAEIPKTPGQQCWSRPFFNYVRESRVTDGSHFCTPNIVATTS